jgi:hypothetical protein
MTSSTRKRASALAGVALVTLVAAACGGSPAASAPASTSAEPPATASTAPSSEPSPSVAASPSASAAASVATTGRIVVPEHRFAVTLPQGWTRIDLQAQDIDAMLDAAGSMNADLAELYSQQIRAMAAQGLVVFAFGPDPGMGSNLNILSTASLGLSLDFLEQANLAQLKSLTNGEIASERVQLPAGEAIHLRYSMSAGTGVPAPTIEQYFLLNGDRQLVVSITNASEADADAISRSIELIG